MPSNESTDLAHCAWSRCPGRPDPLLPAPLGADYHAACLRALSADRLAASHPLYAEPRNRRVISIGINTLYSDEP